MNKQQLKELGSKCMKELDKRSPVLLTVLGIGSGAAAIALTVKATLQAIDLIEEEKCLRIERDEPEEMTKTEIIKTAWKPYISVAVAGTFSAACFIGSCSVHSRRNAALAAAYKISETALTSFKEKAVEEIGEKKVKEIQKKAAVDQMEQHPVKDSEVVILGKGSTLCYDTLSDRYFESDMELIRKAQNDINWMMISEMGASVNDLYERIGLRCNGAGDKMGWDINKGQMEILFDSKITEDGRPCIVLTYNPEPKYRYGDLW